MYGAIIKSSIIASAFGVVALALALTASNFTRVSTTTPALKGDLLVALAYESCPEADCAAFHEKLGGYSTVVDRDLEAGTITLTRLRPTD
ncbi:hypothetical protein [Acuticoccus yangtzensis]|uniref:hypothetical protein n=1 Tax=Acuticoccus yangtzensis TaxID=1443441 RepID=UPI0009498031|nr:hypothetical protein [Acuticoccus yangtzensis]